MAQRSQRTADQSEAEDLMCQGIEVLGGIDSGPEDERRRAQLSCPGNQKVQGMWQAHARSILTKMCSFGSVGGHLCDLILELDGPLGSSRACIVQRSRLWP